MRAPADSVALLLKYFQSARDTYEVVEGAKRSGRWGKEELEYATALQDMLRSPRVTFTHDQFYTIHDVLRNPILRQNEEIVAAAMRLYETLIPYKNIVTFLKEVDLDAIAGDDKVMQTMEHFVGGTLHGGPDPETQLMPLLEEFASALKPEDTRNASAVQKLMQDGEGLQKTFLTARLANSMTESCGKFDRCGDGVIQLGQLQQVVRELVGSEELVSRIMGSVQPLVEEGGAKIWFMHVVPIVVEPLAKLFLEGQQRHVDGDDDDEEQ